MPPDSLERQAQRDGTPVDGPLSAQKWRVAHTRSQRGLGQTCQLPRRAWRLKPGRDASRCLVFGKAEGMLTRIASGAEGVCNVYWAIVTKEQLEAGRKHE